MEMLFSVSGLEEAIERFGKASIELEPSISIKLEEACQDIANYVRMIAPKKSGRYADSVYVRQETPLRFKIGVGAPHAAVVEWGSVPHWILPRYAQALRFEVDGEIVFAKYVHHPGTAPQFILHRAKKANLPRIYEAILEGVREALRG